MGTRVSSDRVADARRMMEGLEGVQLITADWRPGGTLPAILPHSPGAPPPPDISGFDTDSVYKHIASFPADTARLATDNYGDLKLTLGIHKLHKYDAMPLTDHPGMVLYIVAFAAERHHFIPEYDPFTPEG